MKKICLLTLVITAVGGLHNSNTPAKDADSFANSIGMKFVPIKPGNSR
ncbi:MAG: hypothetical protein H8E73_05785, partial [Planctomycetes bacterium]|nr:hypothetical protein [Planctomycetota bacterium]